MASIVREAGADKQLALIRAHPELAGKAMVDKALTAESTHEQSKAGLTDCTPEEFARIQQLNADYNAKFGFPFILAVRGPRGTGPDAPADHRHLARRLDHHPTLNWKKHCATSTASWNCAWPTIWQVPTPGRPRVGLAGTLAQHSDPGFAEKGQLTVTYLTDAHRACAQRISHWMRDCGFDEVGIDAVGNVVGRYGQPARRETLMTGSHYDTVRNGGRYDGRLGIFTPMACVAELSRQGKRLPFDFEVIAFAEEEGAALRGDLPRLRRAHRPVQPPPGWTRKTPTASPYGRPCSTPACAWTTFRNCGATRPTTWVLWKCTSSRARCSEINLRWAL